MSHYIKSLTKTVCLLLSVFISTSGVCQVHTVVLNQSPPLMINAGEDVSILSGEQIRLGGDPTATDGYGDYIYQWEPGDGLDDHTSANPIAIPTETTTYQLTLSDGHNCLLIDEIVVEVRSNSRSDQELLNQIHIFPNPAKGIIHVEFSNHEPIESITVFSAWGRSILNIDPEEIQFGKIDLNLHPFGKGIYLIAIRQKSRVYHKRILLI